MLDNVPSILYKYISSLPKLLKKIGDIVPILGMRELYKAQRQGQMGSKW